MNYAQIRKYDVSNWEGINTSIFFSGCTFKCDGCFNQEAQDFNYGKKYTKDVEDNFILYAKDKYVDGICLLGGEVFQQDLTTILSLVRRIKNEVKKPIYIWSGYTWDKLVKDKNKLDILNYVDILIDGKFDINKKDLTLKFKGSGNQRIIDVQKSLKSNQVILWENNSEVY